MVRLLRQHLSLWHTPYTSHTKMTAFGQKYRCSVPSVSNLQHLSFLVHSVKVHGCSRWELIPKLTSWHSSCVVVYPPGTFAYITMQLPHTVTLEYIRVHTENGLFNECFYCIQRKLRGRFRVLQPMSDEKWSLILLVVKVAGLLYWYVTVCYGT